MALIPLLGMAQNDTKIKYKGVSAVSSLTNSDGELVFQKTVGKDPVIVYDKFFKSYSITFTKENGDIAEMFLSYIEPNYYIDTFKSTYYVLVKPEDGKLVLIATEKIENHLNFLMFYGVIKI